MEAQIQIWIQPGTPLREADWKAQGFDTLALYVGSLEAESKRGYKGNGKPEDSGKNLPLVSFGVLDYARGLKKVVAVYPTYEDLPVESLSYEEVEEGSLARYDLIQFING